MSHDNEMSDEGMDRLLVAVLGGHGCPHEHQLRGVMEILGCLVHAAGGKVEVDMKTLQELSTKSLGIYVDETDPTKVNLVVEGRPEEPAVNPAFVHTPPAGVQ